MEGNDQTTSEEGQSFMRVDNLEGHLRGLILNHEPPTVGNAPYKLGKDTSPNARGAVEGATSTTNDQEQRGM